MRRARRVDANQKEIVSALRKAGRTVEILSDVGRGVPDLLVGIGGRNMLLEVKEGSNDLTDDQREFFDTWRGTVYVVRTVEDAIRVTGPPYGPPP